MREGSVQGAQRVHKVSGGCVTSVCEGCVSGAAACPSLGGLSLRKPPPNLLVLLVIHGRAN